MEPRHSELHNAVNVHNVTVHNAVNAHNVYITVPNAHNEHPIRIRPYSGDAGFGACEFTEQQFHQFDTCADGTREQMLIQIIAWAALPSHWLCSYLDVLRPRLDLLLPLSGQPRPPSVPFLFRTCKANTFLRRIPFLSADVLELMRKLDYVIDASSQRKQKKSEVDRKHTQETAYWTNLTWLDGH